MGKLGEMATVPNLAILAASAFIYNKMQQSPALHLRSEAACDEKYCPPEAYLTHVDRPLNTLLKDQSQGAGLSTPPEVATFQSAYQVTKKDYYQEAMASPGVRLVAHAIV